MTEDSYLHRIVENYDEKCVQIGSFVWKWNESVGWYDADEDEPTFGNEGVLLDEIERLRAAGDALAIHLDAHYGLGNPRPSSIHHALAAWREARRD